MNFHMNKRVERITHVHPYVYLDSAIMNLLKNHIYGAPRWLMWLRGWLLILAQVTISEPGDWAPQALCSVVSAEPTCPSPPPALTLLAHTHAFSQINKNLKSYLLQPYADVWWTVHISVLHTLTHVCIWYIMTLYH